MLRAGEAVGQAASAVAAESGRWVKLTAKSAQDIKHYGLTDTGTPGISWAMAGERGAIKQWLQIEQHGLPLNPDSSS